MLNDKTKAGRKAIAAGSKELTAFLKKQREERIHDVDKLHSQHTRLIAAAQVMFKNDAEARKAVEAGITQHLETELAKRDSARRADYAKQKAMVNEAHAYAINMLKQENIERANARQKVINDEAAKGTALRTANERAKQMFNEGIARMAREKQAVLDAETAKKQANKESNAARSAANQEAHAKEMRLNNKTREKWNNLNNTQKQGTAERKARERELAAYLAKVRINSDRMERESAEVKKRTEKEKTDAAYRNAREEDRLRHEKKSKEDKANQEAKDRFNNYVQAQRTANEESRQVARSNAAYIARVRINSARMEAERIEEIQRAHNAKMEQLRMARGRASIFGEGGWMSRAAMNIGRVTMALFPLYVAWTAVSRAITAAKDAFMAFINAADEKKLQTLRLAALNNGDVEVAKELRNEMVQYAKATAFSVKETMDLAVRVRALGVETENLSDVVKVFGRLSLGNSTAMSRLVKAYTDVIGMGRLLQTEVKQFAQSGLNINKWLMQVYGIDDKAELAKMIEAGVVSSKDVEKALKLAYDAYGPLEFAQLETFAGQWSVMTEGWQEFMAEVGKSDWLVSTFKDLNSLLDIMYRHIKMIPNLWNEAAIAARIYIGIITLGMSEVGRLIWHAAKGMAALMISMGQTNSLDDIIKTMIAIENGMNGGVSPLGDFGKGGDNSKQIEASRAIIEGERERLELVKERHRAELEAIRGDDTMLKQLEARLELQKAYEDSMKRTKDAALDMAARQEAAQGAMYEKREFMIDTQLAKQEQADKKRAEHLATRLEKALTTSMPSKMRQDSVEEWIYLKSKRDEADRERRAEKRWEITQQNEQKRSEQLIEGIEDAFGRAMDNITISDNSGIQGI